MNDIIFYISNRATLNYSKPHNPQSPSPTLAYHHRPIHDAWHWSGLHKVQFMKSRKETERNVDGGVKRRKIRGRGEMQLINDTETLTSATRSFSFSMSASDTNRLSVVALDIMSLFISKQKKKQQKKKLIRYKRTFKQPPYPAISIAISEIHSERELRFLLQCLTYQPKGPNEVWKLTFGELFKG